MNDKIDIDLVEDEDLQRAKAWWKENGSSIIGGVLIGTAIVVGYNFWQSYQEEHDLKVAVQYEQYKQAPDESAALDALLEVDDKAVYAYLARLSAAREAVDAQQFERAEQLLNDVVNSGADQGMRAIAVLRLATVYVASEKADQALSLLESNANWGLPLMDARSDELKGDIYAQKGDAENARTHYQASMDAFTELGQPVSLLKLKLDNL